MKKFFAPALFAAAVVAVILLLRPPGSAPLSENPEPQTGSAPEQSEKPAPRADAAPPSLPEASTPDLVARRVYDTGIRNDNRLTRDESGRNVLTEPLTIASRLHSSDTAPEEDLELIDQILGFYRLSFQRNPVAGDNRMVMEALLGANPHKLVLFPQNHPSLSAGGELLDRWGNPYFFHALSGTEMEIFSAGPDGELNTSDDILHSTRSGKPLTGIEESPDPDVEP